MQEAPAPGYLKNRTMKTTIPPGKFEKIDTTFEPNKLINRLKIMRLKYKPATTKEQADEDRRFWTELRKFYDEEMKRINKEILPGLREKSK